MKWMVDNDDDIINHYPKKKQGPEREREKWRENENYCFFLLFWRSWTTTNNQQPTTTTTTTTTTAIVAINKNSACVCACVCGSREKKKKIGRGSVLCSSTTIFYSSIIICHSCSVDDKRVCVCVLISTEYIKNNNNNITIPFFLSTHCEGIFNQWYNLIMMMMMIEMITMMANFHFQFFFWILIFRVSNN